MYPRINYANKNRTNIKFMILGIFWYTKNEVAILSMMCTQDFDRFSFETSKNFSNLHKTGSVSYLQYEVGSRVPGTYCPFQVWTAILFLYFSAFGNKSLPWNRIQSFILNSGPDLLLRNGSFHYITLKRSFQRSGC